MLGDYKSRTKLIDAIVSKSIENNINGVSIDFKEIDSNNMMRFIIELAPKLREIGITTCIVLNNNMNGFSKTSISRLYEWARIYKYCRLYCRIGVNE